MTGHYEQVARSIGRVVDHKQGLYGDSFAVAPEMLRLLYPDGIRPDQYDDLLSIVRCLDKFKRIATGNDADGENPWLDVGGYAVLEVGRRESKTMSDLRSWGEVKHDSMYAKMVRDTEAHVRPYYHPAMQAASDDLARKMQEAVGRAFPEDFDATVTLGKREEYDDGS